MALPLDYTQAFGNLTAGNLSEAVTMTYTTPLGVYAWILAIFAVIVITYVKTQSAGMSVLTGLLSLSVIQSTASFFGTPILNDKMFFIIIVLGIAVMLVSFWKSH